jgi:hypothetical protein
VASSIPLSVYDDSPEVAGIIFFALASLWFNYFAFCEWRWGQTIGKNATGIEVRSLDGEKLTFGQASLRNLLRLVDFFLIGWAMIALGRRKQRLGDKAAKTIVVRRQPAGRLAEPEIRGAASAATPAQPPTPPPPPPQAPPQPPRPAPAGVQVHWGPRDTIWGLIGGLVLGALVAPAVVLPFDPELETTGGLLAAQGLLGASLLFVAVGMASDWNRGDLRPAFARLGLRGFAVSDLGIMLLTLLGYYIAAGIFASLVLEPDQEDIGGELGVGDQNIAVAITAVLLIVAVAPLSEELFFRGFVFAGFRARWSLWPAALLSGVLFGLVHAPTGLTAAIPLAGLGVALCWLYDRTGSLWPCVIAHALNNGLALALLA